MIGIPAPANHSPCETMQAHRYAHSIDLGTMNDFLDPSTWGVLFSLAGAIVLVCVTILRRRRETRPTLRDIPGLEKLPEELARAAESGRPLHLALGAGEVGGTETLSSLAALQVLEGLVEQAVSYGVAPVITVGDPALLLLAQDVVRRAYDRSEVPELYDPTQVRFVAMAPLAYAAAAIPVGAPERVAGRVVAGRYGAEASLITDMSEQRGISKTAALDAPAAIGALYPATPRLAVGEDLYAAGAQLKKTEQHVTGLIAQDVLRVLLALIILGFAAISIVANWGA